MRSDARYTRGLYLQIVMRRLIRLTRLSNNLRIFLDQETGPQALPTLFLLLLFFLVIVVIRFSIP